jgi:uncharacterized protein YwgA
MVLIGGVVRSLRQRNSWAGETHIQKAAYIAKEIRGVPFESEFVLYKHGPYSFDLNKSVVHMRGRGILSTIQNPGFGPTMEVNEPLWVALDNAIGHYFSQFEAGINSVCDVLATKNVGELERLATAVFLNKSLGDTSIEEKADEMVRIKPHIPPDLARRAFDEVRALS